DAPGGYVSASLDEGATHSPNQRDAGPANRWSVYGVGPRYGTAPPLTLPLEAYTGYPGDGYTLPGYVPSYMQGPPAVAVSDGGGFSDPSVHESNRRVDCLPNACQEPLSIHSCGPWKPPGISGPWPEDEYLFDGGDSDGQVKVRPDGSLEGLDSE